MAKLEIRGEKAYITGSTLKGGKLPRDAEFKMDLVIGFTGASREDLMKVCASGQSSRVALQSKLRSKSVNELRRMNGKFATTFADCHARVEESTQDKLAKLSFADFFETLKPYGVSEEGARKMFNKKHGIVEPEEENEDNEYEDEYEDENDNE